MSFVEIPHTYIKKTHKSVLKKIDNNDIYFLTLNENLLKSIPNKIYHKDLHHFIENNGILIVAKVGEKFCLINPLNDDFEKVFNVTRFSECSMYAYRYYFFYTILSEMEKTKRKRSLTFENSNSQPLSQPISCKKQKLQTMNMNTNKIDSNDTFSNSNSDGSGSNGQNISLINSNTNINNKGTNIINNINNDNFHDNNNNDFIRTIINSNKKNNIHNNNNHMINTINNNNNINGINRFNTKYNTFGKNHNPIVSKFVNNFPICPIKSYDVNSVNNNNNTNLTNVSYNNRCNSNYNMNNNNKCTEFNINQMSINRITNNNNKYNNGFNFNNIRTINTTANSNVVTNIYKNDNNNNANINFGVNCNRRFWHHNISNQKTNNENMSTIIPIVGKTKNMMIELRRVDTDTERKVLINKRFVTHEFIVIDNVVYQEPTTNDDTSSGYVYAKVKIDPCTQFTDGNRKWNLHDFANNILHFCYLKAGKRIPCQKIEGQYYLIHPKYFEYHRMIRNLNEIFCGKIKYSVNIEGLIKKLRYFALNGDLKF
jgi:hypothetical protein